MMRFRLWLANLISGGEIARLENENGLLIYAGEVALDRRRFLEDEREILQRALSSEHHSHTLTAKKLKVERDETASRKVALRDIAAMETPKANATVKRMAKRAREALE